MWRLSATLVVALLLSLKASGKSVRGVFRGEAARQENGQFITKFMYQGNGADVQLWPLTCHSSTGTSCSSSAGAVIGSG